MSDLRAHRGQIYCRENRSDEGGMQVLMRLRGSEISELTPADFNVGARVHEYGGNSHVVLDGGIVFTNFVDHRLATSPQPHLAQSGFRHPRILRFVPGQQAVDRRALHQQ